MARKNKPMTFSLDISRWCEKAGARADLVVRKTAMDMFSRIVMRTPVDTGRARANWNPAIGGQATGTSGAVDPTGQETQARIEEVVSRAKAGDTIWLTNNLPYIRRLETGWSKQAPAGMVGITVNEFKAIVDAAVGAAKAER